MTARDKAAQLLAHYFRLAWERAGLGWDSDNEAEMEELVDWLIAAASEDRG